MKRLLVLIVVGVLLIGSSSIILDRSQDQLAALYQSRPSGQATQFQIIDSRAPVRSSLAPLGVLAAGTNQVNISLATDEAATCRYNTSAGVSYQNMNNFDSTGGISHSQLITGLTNGTSYNYYVRCADRRGNANPDDAFISFSVANPVAMCGNSIVEPAIGEQCDDGNTSETDGCNNACRATFGSRTTLTSSNAGEVSGAEWHNRSNSFWLVDDGGKMVQVASNGSVLGRWGNLGDIEGVTVVDTNSDFIYIGRENPPSIIKWNTQTHLPNTVTAGNFWPLTDLQTCPTGDGGMNGLEALTFVENDGTGDIFYAGSQCNGRVYKYRVNQTAGTIQNLGMIAGKPSNSNDLAALYFDPQYQVLYWIYDDQNMLYATRKDSSVALASWNLNVSNTPDQQESFFIKDGEAYLGTDTGTGGTGIFYKLPFAGLRY